MNLLRSMIIIGFMTFISRILGFAKDIIVALIFGAGTTTDSFLVAFKLPNLLRRIFAEGAFSQSFVPVLAEYKDSKDDSFIKNFISCVSGLLIISLILITLIGMIISPWVISIMAPGFAKQLEKLALTVLMSRIMFPYVIMVSLNSLASSILNTWNNFTKPAFAPVILNLGMIIVTVLGSPIFNPPVIALSFSVIVGSILQLIYQLRNLKELNMSISPTLAMHVGSKHVLKLMVPTIFNAVINQVSVVVNTIFASFLRPGSISWMYYADRLIEFPSGILGVAVGTIWLPLLSKSFSNKNDEEYSYLLDCGLRICFLLSAPSAVILTILSYPVITAFFQYGEFSAFDTLMTQKTLIVYSFGLLGLVLVKILTIAFCARQKADTTVYAGLITLLCAQTINLTCISRYKHIGLALSIAASSYVNAGILYWQLRKQKMFNPQPEWFKFIYRLFFASILLLIVTVNLLIIVPDWTKGNIAWRLLRLSLVFSLSMLSYMIALWLVDIDVKKIIDFEIK